jgi:ribosomal protein S18 acetylase RimI-like enzyme
MSVNISFRPLGWPDLQQFISKEKNKRTRDVDRDVLFMNLTLYTAQTVEGFYLDETLVGFARWDSNTRHLSNLYVSAEARGQCIASRFIDARRILSLCVLPSNHLAKKLYSRLGFGLSSCPVPSREFMSRALQ